ncbi:MAG: GGDEF domain-containing phosphodiesterase [Butyrivibrio sp.]|nr:GGDEF domain-containing phosphodiesterase [Butyrivibrio sp.]
MIISMANQNIIDVWFNVCSLISLIIIIVIFSLERQIRERQNVLFKLMLFSSLWMVISDLLYNLAYEGAFIVRPASYLKVTFWFNKAMIVCYVIYTVLYTVMAFKDKRNLRKDEKFSLWSYVFFNVIAWIVYFIIGSEALFETWIVISLLFLFFTLHNPSGYIDADSQAWNFKSFRAYTDGRIAKGDPFVLIDFNIEDLTAVEVSKPRYEADLLLKQITDYFRSLDESSYLFRNSNKDFALVMGPATDFEEAMDCARRAIMRFAENWLVGSEQVSLYMRSCVFEYPKDFRTVDEAINLVRLALRKNSRHDKYILTIKNLNMEKAVYDAKIDSILKRALEERLLEVYYQPIYDIKTGKFISAEALLRLKDEELGVISPGVFIPIAEQSGTIVQIDKYVFDDVCNMLRNSKALEYGLEYVEINLSVMDAIQDDFTDYINNIIKKYDINPKLINLEVTETSGETVTKRMNENICKLSDLGFEFSLDDFGTGFSNIGRIHKMPFKIIKIDKSLIQAAMESDINYDVLHNMIDIVKLLEMESVAEGVETKEQLDALTRLGIDHIQGYYYSPALPQDEFLKYIQKHNVT